MTEENKKKSGKGNTPLSKARAAKNDEFYTRRKSIEEELWHYRPHFADKVVYCNCDDPKVSEFYKYFRAKFCELGLRRLIATCYKNQNPDIFSPHTCDRAVHLDYDGKKETFRLLQGDGDFRKPESVELLRRADIVVTNPPFSLFREYVAQLVEENKRFLIIGNFNAVSYKDIFRLIMMGKLWLGFKKLSGGMLFEVPPEYADYLVAYKKEGGAYKIVDGKVLGLTSAVWFTNLPHKKRKEDLILTARYGDGSAYPKYDNYDAVEAGFVANIPKDYAGVMGVTTTFLEQYNPEQFDILGKMTTTTVDECNFGYPYVNGKRKYARVLIRNRRPQ